MEDKLYLITDSVEHLLIYFYNAAGNPIGMQYRNSTYSIGTVESYLFVTAIDYDHYVIYELKPCNYRAICRGLHQLERYIDAATARYGGIWTGILITYR